MRKTVCLIVPSNLIYAPYYFRYIEILNKAGEPFDTILWNREGLEEKLSGRIFEFNIQDQTNNGDWKKVFKFIFFSRFVKKIIKKNKYKKLIFLGSNAGNATLLYFFLRKNYNKQYWFDIRDFTYENFRPFYFIEKRCILHSCKTVISSKGYKEFLPEYPYIIAHNFDRRNIEQARGTKIIDEKVLRISFIGNMRYYEENIRFIDLFANDNRFRLQYFGTGNEPLKKYCQKKGVENTLFCGRFDAEKTKDFYARTDIINNLYGNHSQGLRTALSNKLYYALELQKPILVCPGTYMEEVSVSAGIGFTIHYDNSDIKEELIRWYEKFNCSSAREILRKIDAEDRLFEIQLEEYIKG